MKVWLVTDGDGSDGSEWRVLGIFSSSGAAETAKIAYEEVDIHRGDGSSYRRYLNEVEEWEVDPEELR